jgi:hypothetical protein
MVHRRLVRCTIDEDRADAISTDILGAKIPTNILTAPREELPSSEDSEELNIKVGNEIMSNIRSMK